MGGWTEEVMEEVMEGKIDRGRDRGKDRQMDRQADRQIDRWMDGHTEPALIEIMAHDVKRVFFMVLNHYECLPAFTPSACVSPLFILYFTSSVILER